MNMQRFRRVLARIERHPDQWVQCLWKTSEYMKTPRCCFLGHTMLMFCRRHGNNEHDTMMNGGLALDASNAETRWINDTARTLDDFRTIARRPMLDVGDIRRAYK